MSIMDSYNVSERNNKKATNDFGVYSFYEKVLAGYVSLLFDDENNVVKGNIEVSPEDQKRFMGLMINYEASKSMLYSELSFDDMVADAFYWYVADGTIVMENGKFYINPDELLKRFNEYNRYMNSIESSFSDDHRSKSGMPYSMNRK